LQLKGEVNGKWEEAKVLIDDWRQQYNQIRPHSVLGYRPPAPEAIMPQRNKGQALTQQLVQ